MLTISASSSARLASNNALNAASLAPARLVHGSQDAKGRVRRLADPIHRCAAARAGRLRVGGRRLQLGEPGLQRLHPRRQRIEPFPDRYLIQELHDV